MKCEPGCQCGRHRSTVHSAETRAKISAAKMGHEVSEEARAKIGAASRGRTLSKQARAKLSKARTVHGANQRGKRTGAYRSWDGMIQRCTNPKAAGYAQYGGAGITVCARWRVSFPDFLADMGERPAGRYSIDRIDATRGYEPNNCRWATDSEQMKNRPNFNPVKR